MATITETLATMTAIASVSVIDIQISGPEPAAALPSSHHAAVGDAAIVTDEMRVASIAVRMKSRLSLSSTVPNMTENHGIRLCPSGLPWLTQVIFPKA